LSQSKNMNELKEAIERAEKDVEPRLLLGAYWTTMRTSDLVKLISAARKQLAHESAPVILEDGE